MKPIKLCVSGLHSFRERQEIDFTTLTEMGMFGIFGPTGSGKSTILDAITLGLYGDVGRAGRNTQAILNHAEKRIEVVFEFEIGSTQNRKRYRVERVYKRGQGFSVEHLASRLLELEVGVEGKDYGLVVIADAKAQVNQAIRSILGLEQSDFTRAVVLPQGKFAEFLQLTGSDRNAMIERLFGLEQYGKSLLERVNTRAKRVADDLRVVQASQAELGDASEAAVKAAQVALDEAVGQQQQALRERQAAVARLQDAERLHDLLREKRTVGDKCNELEGEASGMASTRASLHTAARADKVWPFVAAWRDAQEAVVSARSTAEVQTTALAQAEQTWVAAVKQNDIQQASRVKLEPAMLQQQGRLQEALVQEKELRKLEVRLVEDEAGYGQILAQSEVLAANCLTASQALNHLSDERLLAEKKLAEYTVPPDTRQQINTLRQTFQTWTQTQQATQHQQLQYQQREEKRRMTEAMVQKVLIAHEQLLHEQALIEVKSQELSDNNPIFQFEDLRRIRDWIVELRPLIQSLARVEQSVAETKDRIATVQLKLHELTIEADKCREMAERTELVWRELRDEWDHRQAISEAELIIKLTAQLQVGVPCPVCGSEQHSGSAMGHVASTSRTVNADLNPNDLVATKDADITSDVNAAERIWRQADTAFRDADAKLAQMKLSLGLLTEEITREQQHQAHVLQSLSESWLAHEDLRRVLVLSEGLRQGISVFVSESPCDHEEWSGFLHQFELQSDEANGRWQDWEVQRQNLDDMKADLKNRFQQTAHNLALAQAEERAAQTEAAAQLISCEAVQTEWQAAQQILHKAMAELGLSNTHDDIVITSEMTAAIAACITQLDSDDEMAATMQNVLKSLNARWTDAQAEHKALEQAANVAEFNVREQVGRLEQLRADVASRQAQLTQITGGEGVNEAIEKLANDLADLYDVSERTQAELQAAVALAQSARENAMRAHTAKETQEQSATLADEHLRDALVQEKFATEHAVQEARLEEGLREEYTARLKRYEADVQRWSMRYTELTDELAGQTLDDDTFAAIRHDALTTEEAYKMALETSGSRQERLQNISLRQERWQLLEQSRVQSEQVLTRLSALQSALRGNSFVQYVAREQMERVTRLASHRLAALTRGRYALTLTDDGSFLMQDHHNGGALRPVSTLSGGETFLTSLALALALSAQIQLRGQHPLEFFFLDEGFGTLDPDLLDVVISSLEKLQLERMSIGLISHVPELRQRLQRRLVVEPAAPAGHGTRVHIEFA